MQKITDLVSTHFYFETIRTQRLMNCNCILFKHTPLQVHGQKLQISILLGKTSRLIGNFNQAKVGNSLLY